MSIFVIDAGPGIAAATAGRHLAPSDYPPSLERIFELFVTNPDRENIPDTKFGDLTLQYFMGYLTFNFGHGRLVPYFTIGGGVADFDSTLPGFLATRSKSRGTAAIGGGVKYFFNPHFGIRGDTRFYSSYLGSETVICGYYYTCTQTNWVTNVVANGGIVIAF